MTTDIVRELQEETQNRPTPPPGKDDIQVRDTVRISKVKSVFAKGYLPNWTEEILTVSRIGTGWRQILYF